MKRTLISLALLAASTQANAWYIGGEAPTHPYDYAIHTGVSAIAVPVIADTLSDHGMDNKHAALVSSGIVLGLGLLKELSDTNFGWDDLAADVAGVGIGYTFTIKFK